MAPTPHVPSDPQQILASRRSFVAGVGAITGAAALSQIPLAGSALGG